MDIQCCVHSSQRLPPGSRPASSTLDDIHIPGIHKLNLDNYIVPDSSIWSPEAESEYDMFRIQDQQSELPSSDVRVSQSLDLIFDEGLLTPESFPEQADASLWVGLDPEFDNELETITDEQEGSTILSLASPFAQSPGYPDDPQLAVDLFEGDKDPFSPLLPASWVEG